MHISASMIKLFLTSKPVLKAPDFEKRFILQVDASDVGIGAVLLQEHSGILHPVCFTSIKLKTYQRKYSTIEKEALAILLALDKFHVYIGSPTETLHIYSDHNPLSFIHKMENKNQRLTRWNLMLQHYHLEIHHIKGTDNVVADYLSRIVDPVD